MVKTDHLVTFSTKGVYLACIDDVGKLKIWETATNQLKQEFVPNVHLSSPITCLRWIEIENELSKTSFYLALGSKKGNIAIYSFAKGGIEFELKGHANTVTDIYYDGENTLYSAGFDSKVIKWDFAEQKQVETFKLGTDKPTAVLVVSSHLVTAGKQIKLWDLKSHELRKTYAGHRFTINSLKYFEADDKIYCISLSTRDRHICIWELDGESQDSISSFVTEDAAWNICFRYFQDTTLSAVIVTETGLAQFYLKRMDKTNEPTIIKKRTNVQLVTEEGTEIPIIATEFYQKGVLIAYGSRTHLKFEVLSPNLDVSESVLVRDDPKKVAKHDEVATHNTVVPIVESTDVEYLNPISAGRKVVKLSEQTFQERLDKLNASEPSDPKSMVKLLVQGLTNKDSTILGIVFDVTDERVIASTLRRLSVKMVSRLVNVLSSLMQKRTPHVNSAAIWLRILCQIHTSQLLAIGPEQLRDLLSVCLGTIDQRVDNFPRLSSFGGRLDLLVSQLQRKDFSYGDDSDKNLLEYEDEKDDDDNIKMESDTENEDEEWTESESDGEELNGDSIHEVKGEMDVSD